MTGIENANHEELNAVLGCESFFYHLYTAGKKEVLKIEIRRFVDVIQNK